VNIHWEGEDDYMSYQLLRCGTLVFAARREGKRSFDLNLLGELAMQNPAELSD
jgi:hypothetical protein